MQFILESFVMDFNVLSHPQLLKHGDKLFLHINIVFESKLYFLFSLKNFLILILEHDRAEVIELRDHCDDLFIFEICETRFK